MAYFAKIDGNNIVTHVVVMPNTDPQINIQWLTQRKGGTWLETAYDGRFRGKYAGIGDLYDPDSDTFKSPE